MELVQIKTNPITGEKEEFTVAEQLDLMVLQKALQNSKTFVAKSGQNYLKSASGTEISMETIKKATQLVSSGVKTADEVALLLPRQLADGSEFRSVFQKSFSKKPVVPTDMSNARRMPNGGYSGSN